MKRIYWIIPLVATVLLIVVGAVGAQGQDAEAPQPLVTAALASAPINSTFTYQGQLRSNGNAVNGQCDFQFGLWDAVSAGIQVGITQTLSAVNVVNGLFTVSLDFGANAFTGNARWLSIAVRCPIGDAYTTRTSRVSEDTSRGTSCELIPKIDL